MDGDSRKIPSFVIAFVLIACALTVFAGPLGSAPSGKAQITILYDAFSETPDMQKDWGYSALIEYAGKRMLFDTGNNPEILEQNAKARASTYQSWTLWSCRTGMAITWED